MKNRTIRSAVYNQLGKNKVIKGYGKIIKVKGRGRGRKIIPVIIRIRRNIADFIGIESSEKTVYAYKNIFGFYKISYKK